MLNKDELTYHPLYCARFDKDIVSFQDCLNCPFGKKIDDIITCEYREDKFDSKTKAVMVKDYKPDYIKTLSNKESLTLDRGGGLGDLIRLTAIIKEIKKRLPNLKINVRCNSEYLPIFYNNPFIDNLFTDKDNVKTDNKNLVLDLRKGFALEDHSTEGIAKRLHIKLSDNLLFYKETEEEAKKAKLFLAKQNIIQEAIKIGISPLAGTPDKVPTLSFWKNLYYLVKAMYKGKLQLFFFANRSIPLKPLGNSIFIEALPIRETAAIMKEMHLFISADSGLLYLALALRIPCLGLFGITPGNSVKYPEFYYIDKRKEVCKQYCYGKNICKEVPGKCIKAISPEEVAIKIGNILDIKPAKLRKNEEFYEIDVLFTKGGIGDTLTITPGLRELKRRYPLSKINVVLSSEKNAEVLRNNPVIDSIIVTDNPQRYRPNVDLVFDIAEYPAIYEAKIAPNVKKSRIQLYNEALGNKRLQNKQLVFYPTPSELEWAKYMFNILKGRTIIAIQPHSGELYKDWPIEYWEKLVELITSYFPQTLILNFDHTVDIQKTFLIRDSIRKVITLLRFADMIICPDSLFLHIGGMYNVQTVGLFGPSGYRAGYKNVVVCQRQDMSCCPCWRNATMKCNPLPGKQRSYEGQEESKCLRDLTPELVFMKIKPILKELCYGNKGSSSSARRKGRTTKASSSKRVNRT